MIDSKYSPTFLVKISLSAGIGHMTTEAGDKGHGMFISFPSNYKWSEVDKWLVATFHISQKLVKVKWGNNNFVSINLFGHLTA